MIPSKTSSLGCLYWTYWLYTRPWVTRFLVSEHICIVKLHCMGVGKILVKWNPQVSKICVESAKNPRKIHVPQKCLNPNSKLSFCNVRTPRGRISQGLTVNTNVCRLSLWWPIRVKKAFRRKRTFSSIEDRARKKRKDSLASGISCHLGGI